MLSTELVNEASIVLTIDARFASSVTLDNSRTTSSYT